MKHKMEQVPQIRQIKPDKLNVRENRLTYFPNYTKTDKDKKPVPFLHKLKYRLPKLGFISRKKWLINGVALGRDILPSFNPSHYLKLTVLLTIIALFLTGCSGLMNYYTEVYENGKKVGEVRGNVPAKVETKNLKIDQRSETIWEKIGKIAPKNIKIEQ